MTAVCRYRFKPLLRSNVLKTQYSAQYLQESQLCIFLATQGLRKRTSRFYIKDTNFQWAVFNWSEWPMNSSKYTQESVYMYLPLLQHSNWFSKVYIDKCWIQIKFQQHQTYLWNTVIFSMSENYCDSGDICQCKFSQIMVIISMTKLEVSLKSKFFFCILFLSDLKSTKSNLPGVITYH